MINILFLLLVFTSISYSEDKSCFGEILQTQELTKAFALPNCVKKELLVKEQKITSETFNNSSSSKKRPICDECKKDFLSKIGHPQTVYDNKIESKRAYFEVMYKELEKSMAATLSDIVTLRTLINTGSDYSESKTSCNVKTFEAQMSKCGNFQKELFKSTGFSEKITNEMVALISKPQLLLNPSMFTRPKTDESCKISDREIMTLVPSYLEDSISAPFINYVASLSAKSEAGLYESLDKFKGQGNESFKDLIQKHPVLSSLAKKPNEFIKLFQSISLKEVKNGNNEEVKSLFKSHLYSKSNGDILDKDIAERCNKTFTSFLNTVCSKDFEEGNISLGNLNNFKKLYSGKKIDQSSEVSTTPKESFDIFLFCNETASNRLSLDNDIPKISSWMGQENSNRPLNEYLKDRYNNDFKNHRNKICIYSKNEPNVCTDQSLSCNLYKQYKKSLNPNSSEAKVALSADKSVNNLLETFIVATKPLSKEVKQVLIPEGIIPDETGNKIKSEDVIERLPSYYKESFARNTLSRSKTPLPDQSSEETHNSVTTESSTNSFPDSPVQNSHTQKVFNSTTNQDNEPVSHKKSSLRDIQDEIRRKISNRSPTIKEKTQESPENFTEVANSETVNGNSLASKRVFNDNFSDNLPKEQPSSSQLLRGSHAIIEEKKIDKNKEQMNKALEGMGKGSDVSSTNVGAQVTKAAEAMTVSSSKAPAQGQGSENDARERFDIKTGPENEHLPLAEILAAKFSIDSNHPLMNAINNRKSFLLRINGVSLFLKPNPELGNYDIELIDLNNNFKTEKIIYQVKVFLNNKFINKTYAQ